jgi:imidazolonepropionase-like amidohydrolase
MPGLIDCHCHVLQSTSNLAALSVESANYAAARAFEIMRGMLSRGSQPSGMSAAPISVSQRAVEEDWSKVPA